MGNQFEFISYGLRYYGKRAGWTQGRFDITNHEKKRLAFSDVEEVKKWPREVLDEFIDRK